MKKSPLNVTNDNNSSSTLNHRSFNSNSTTANSSSYRVPPDGVPAIGIDLGTTYCCVGVFERGKVNIIANELGNKTTPSYVAFAGDKILIGDPAKSQATRNVTNTIFDVKRLMGRTFDDISVQADMKLWPFKVIKYGGQPKIEVEFNDAVKYYYPEEISAMLLSKMKEIAESYLGNTVTNAVITVPAYFNDAQRQATKDAARIAKLNVLRIINEPTAAALAYGLEKKKNNNERNVLIFDLGGGTFDVSILTIKNKFFEVKSTGGISHLGGEDFDDRMVNHLAREFHQKHYADLTSNKKAMRRLKTACAQAKRTLSSTVSTTIDIDALHLGIDFFSKITRSCFEKLNEDLFQGILEPVEKAIQDAGMHKADIDDIVMIGGSSRIPKVQQLLQEYFDGKELFKAINPDEAVAYGAAIQAALLTTEKSKEIQGVLLVDTTPLSLGIERANESMVVIVPKHTSIPNRKTQDFTTAEDYQTTVHISVLEGGANLSKDNDLLGDFSLKGISPAPAGVARIQVTFNIDANGILNVSAVDLATGNRNEITILYNKRRLSDGEINRMIRENDAYKAEHVDEKAKESADELKTYCQSFKSSIQKDILKNQTSQPDQVRIIQKCDDIINWVNSNSSLGEEVYVRKKQELEKIFDFVISMPENRNKKNEKYAEILNVKKGATEAQIEEGFKQGALKYHPDRYKGDKEIGKWWFEIVSSARDALRPLSRRPLTRKKTRT